MPDCVLICGLNPTLLLTRTLVLEHAGFRVRVLGDLHQLPGSTEDRVLFCSSLGESDQIEAIRLIRKRQPEARILVVGEDRALEEEKVFRMSAFAGAETMIESARKLLQESLRP